MALTAQERAQKLLAARRIMSNAEQENRDCTPQESARFDTIMAEIQLSDMESPPTAPSDVRGAEDRIAKLRRAREICETAGREHRSKTEKESIEQNRLLAEVDDYDRRTGHEGSDDERQWFNQVGQRRTAHMDVDDGPTGEWFRDANTGRKFRAFKPGESLRSHLLRGNNSEPVSVGRMIVAMVTGDWSEAEAERRAASTSPSTSGGYLLNPELALDVIDLARNRSAVMQAGARTIPMNTTNLAIVKLTGDPTAKWRHEGVAVTQSQPTFGRVELYARTLAAIVPITIELVEDAPNAAEVVERAITSALSLELDRVALRGIGAAAEPLGLRNTDGLGEQTSVGVMNWDDVSEAVQSVLTANGPEAGEQAMIWPARTAGAIDRLKDSNGLYMKGSPWTEALSKFVSNQIPINLGGGSNETEVYVGDFSQLVFGMRSDVVMEVLREGTVGSDNATSELKVFIRAYLRADVGVLRPDHFERLLGITN